MGTRLLTISSHHLDWLLSLFGFVDMQEGKIASMEDLGVYESYKLKRQVVLSASEAAEMILRVDDILRSTPRKRDAH